MTGCGVEIARPVDGAHLEGVAAIGQAAVGRGLVQAANAPASIWHWKPARPLPPVSLPVKAKVGELLLLGLVGLAVIVVSGGVVSLNS